MRKLVACFLAMLILLISPLTSFAKQGEQAVASCVACHGEKGNSLAPIFPKLAGLNKKYLIKQLEDFQLHKRKNPTMEGLAAGLSEEAIADIAAYYEAQTIQGLTAPVADSEDEEESETGSQLNHEDLIKMGELLYKSGNLESQVPACSACHAPDANGNSLAGFPTLKNQHATYLVSTLKQFRDGERLNDSTGMMHMTAKRMSTQEITAVSAYLSELK
ncbi:MAG: c-type cytochrome [Methylococcales bacterium]